MSITMPIVNSDIPRIKSEIKVYEFELSKKISVWYRKYCYEKVQDLSRFL